MNKFKYNTARINTLSELMSFPAIRGEDWEKHIYSNPEAGDLVTISCAKPSKWYLSWVEEVDAANDRYLLKSIDDHSLCWWSNVSIDIYDRGRLNNRPSWRWSDDQFELNRKWSKACYRNDAYIVLPCQVDFDQEGNAILDVRIRFNFDYFSNPKIVSDWKRLTIKEMEKHYIESYELYNKRPSKARK